MPVNINAEPQVKELSRTKALLRVPTVEGYFLKVVAKIKKPTLIWTRAMAERAKRASWAGASGPHTNKLGEAYLKQCL